MHREEPPPPRKLDTKWSCVVAKLRADPGEWYKMDGRYRPGSRRIASYLRTTYGLQVVMRWDETSNEDGLKAMWARWPEQNPDV